MTTPQNESRQAGAALGRDLVRQLFELRGHPRAASIAAVRALLVHLDQIANPATTTGALAAVAAGLAAAHEEDFEG